MSPQCGVTPEQQATPSWHRGLVEHVQTEINEEEPAHGTAPPVMVCMLRSSSKYTVPIELENLSVEAVVDSAAEVTIISDRIYNSLQNPPQKLYDVRLDTAGRQISMRGFVAGPVKMMIGQSYHHGQVYVAPIEQDMLFGVDIMTKGSAVIDMGKNVFIFKGHDIAMNNGQAQSGNPQVALVTVARRTVIPPNSAALIPCKMDRSMPDYVIEPEQSDKVYGPRVVSCADTDPVVCIVNCTDRYRLLKKGREIATATEVEKYMMDDDNDDNVANVCDVSTAPDKEQAEIVPDHLKMAFEGSKEHISSEQQVRLAALLNEYQDVIAERIPGCFRQG